MLLNIYFDTFNSYAFAGRSAGFLNEKLWACSHNVLPSSHRVQEHRAQI
ncbi:hypothetical protein HE1_00961 [Holospora elegans E1]|uniref:Uncharacterized protein n=1 Tax=Holospora elegans E1 TaxID=1427503 RepID=A0A023DYP9_9PROT|nr:hypothetical protein HE1_00961 [Holospora elegans E1]